MPSRAILFSLLLSAAAPVFAEPAGERPEPARFEQRVVAILNAGGTVDTIQGRLNRVGDGLDLTPDQRIAVDAVRTLVRSRGRPDGLSIAEAEAFAARNPASPVSAMLIAEAALGDNQPERSADALIGAASKAGSLVQLVSPTTVSKLSDELDALSDRKRTADLAKALLYSGWGRGSASLRSYLAMAAIRDEIAACRVEQARRVLVAVKSPASLHEILIDNRLAPLRGDVVQAAGPRLESGWQDFLTKTRDEWLSRGDALSAVAYAEALKQASQYDALAEAFLVRFMRGYNCPSDTVGRSVAADLADSLARTGRWTKAEDVMRRSGGISPPVYAAMLLERGDFGRARSLLDRSLRAADRPESKAEEKAIAWVQAARACAAFRTGDRSVALDYDPALLDVSARLFVMLCTERATDARTALVAALENEDERADALRWMQPFTDPIVQSTFRTEMNERIRALQRDPAVVAASSRYGVILDWPLTSSVRQLTAIDTIKPTAPWQCGDQSDWATTMPAPESIRLPDSQP